MVSKKIFIGGNKALLPVSLFSDAVQMPNGAWVSMVFISSFETNDEAKYFANVMHDVLAESINSNLPTSGEA